MNQPDSTKPSLHAALLLLARDLIPEGIGGPRSVAEILALTGAHKSQAYEIRSRLQELLPTLCSWRCGITSWTIPAPSVGEQSV